MTEDVVRAMGFLALGTRLKRIGERLQTQTQALLEECGIDAPSAHFPLLAALDRLGPLSVGEMTEALGVAQPGVTRLADKLEAGGLIRSAKAHGDRRVRILALSAAGRRLMARAQRAAWPLVEAAVADACAGLKGPLLAQLAALEDALDSAPLHARVEEVEDESA